jgi:type II secretion system protein N
VIKLWIKKNLKFLLLGGALFVVFVYLRFPVENFQPRIISAIEQAIPGVVVKMEGPYTTLVPGVAIKNLVLKSTSTGAKVRFSRVAVRIRLLPLLLRKISVGFSAKSKDVAISGVVSNGILGRDMSAFELDIGRINLDALFKEGLINERTVAPWKQNIVKKNPYLGFMISKVDFSGKLAGDIGISGSKETVRNFDLSTAKLDLSISGSQLKASGLVTGGLDIGKLNIQMESEKGKAKVKKLTAIGKDLKIDSKGNLNFEKPPKRGTINMQLGIEVPKTARENILGQLNLALSQIGIELKRGKVDYKITGALGGRLPPRIVPVR